MTELFSPQSLVDAMLRFEAALADALGEVGIAPSTTSDAVSRACRQPVADPERLLESTWERGTPVIALIEEIAKRLESDTERRWIHYGATTQDTVDTAHVLLARDALKSLEERLSSIARLMNDLMHRQSEQLQVGRTFLRQGDATSFGLRVAGWLDPTLTHIEDVRTARSRLVVQLGGPVGTLAAYGDSSVQVVSALAHRLELGVPDTPWHGDRSRIRALVSVTGDAVATLAKVATDLTLLSQDEVGEVTMRAGSSSSMPGKQNPIDAVRVLAAADVCHAAAAMISGTRPHELDRAVGGWHVEWLALPLLFQSASAVVEATERCLKTLEIDSETMTSRVEAPTSTSVGSPQIEAVGSRYRSVITS